MSVQGESSAQLANKRKLLVAEIDHCHDVLENPAMSEGAKAITANKLAGLQDELKAMNAAAGRWA